MVQNREFRIINCKNFKNKFQDIRKALLIVRARRRDEHVSVGSESAIGLDPKYVPFEEAVEYAEELEDSFDDQAEFRQRSFSNVGG